MGDFNLPGINWLDGSGQVTYNPSYGVELNNVFLDQINDTGFNQFVNTPTRNSNILDLVLSTSSTILDLTTAPGMSDHEAVVFHYNIDNTNVLYHMRILYRTRMVCTIRECAIRVRYDFPYHTRTV